MNADFAIDSLDTDILVLGAGGAGLCAALHASDRSPMLSVTVVVKGLLGRAGCTRMVQGGYNAVLTEPDSLDAHFLDTLQGGGWINDQDLVWALVTEAPKRVLELEARYGCFFDRQPNGRIHQKPFAGQSHDRTIHKGDLTGIEIMNRLTEQAWRRPGIRALEEHRAVELLRDDEGRVGGALLLDIRRGDFLAVRSRATLLAMGGGPTMYRVIACSADKSADGIALALRAGARLKDMEMVQFHPTGLIVPNSLMTGALLEEGLRGAGGRLFNGRGERYMERYDPARMERSTRDLVARASFTEVLEGRGTPHGGVWIDVSHLGAKMVEANFRGMVKRCRDFGYDLPHDPVEVGPTAHFMMGGVVISPECATDVEGLFAAGEDAGGVHGANRLGGNGVADSTVFGGIAGDTMAEWVVSRAPPRLSQTATEAAAARVAGPLGRGDGDNIYALLTRLRAVMWDHVGLIRAGENLKQALGEIEEIGRRAEGAAVPGGGPFNLAWQDWLNLQNQATAAWLICRSALERTESRGSHFRKDFPEPAVELVNVFVGFADEALPKVWTEPVRLTRLTPGAARPGMAVEVGD
ncbi:MAG TPA: FAD-dependent oxidoreductase [Methylomirabilota bacterium]|jgi:succinate dehydrogenase/fumarate reductase flavoprotein subunit|nr:FAD-dependent oxidoreductase [Methylomirabilota bacterium]